MMREEDPGAVPRLMTKTELAKWHEMWRKHDEAVAKVILRARGQRPRPGQKLDLTVR